MLRFMAKKINYKSDSERRLEKVYQRLQAILTDPLILKRDELLFNDKVYVETELSMLSMQDLFKVLNTYIYADGENPKLSVIPEKLLYQPDLAIKLVLPKILALRKLTEEQIAANYAFTFNTLNLFDDARNHNNNAAIVGVCGTGKTALLEDTIYKTIDKGGNVILFDKSRKVHQESEKRHGKSLNSIIKQKKGRYIEVNQGFKLNPFGILMNDDDTSRPSLLCMVDLLLLMADITEANKVSSLVREPISEAILKAQHIHKDKTKLIHIYHQINLLYVSSTPPLKEALQLYLNNLNPFIKNGTYASTFDANELYPGINSENDSGLIIFELEDFRANNQSEGGRHFIDVVQMSLMFISFQLLKHHFIKNSNNLQKQQIFAIDDFFDTDIPKSRIKPSFIESLHREARYSNISMVTISQSINDYAQSEQGLSFFRNCDKHVLFRQGQYNLDTSNCFEILHGNEITECENFRIVHADNNFQSECFISNSRKVDKFTFFKKK